MVGANGVNTPMFSSCKLSKYVTDVLSNPTNSMSIVCALQYVTLTRPDIAFSVNKAYDQFMVQPLETHQSVVKCVLQYLSGTADHGLLLSPSNSVQPLFLKAYSDFD